MTKDNLKIKLLLVSVVIGIGVSICYAAKTVAIPKAAKVSREILIKNIEKNNLPREIKQQNTVNNKNNSVKSASQQLVGGWTNKLISDSGEEYQQTGFFAPDGTYSAFITRNAVWYLANKGTWSFENGTLYQNSEMTGKKSNGTINFVSQDKYTYNSSTTNNKTTWQKVVPDPNLSAEQLFGTWSIVFQERVGGGLIDDISQTLISRLIELNPDGTFRYENLDGRHLQLGYRVGRSSGTWEYLNNGYADGLLSLKDSQGKLISIGSVNWTSNGNFLHIHLSQFDFNKNEYTLGRIEKFNRTDSRIE